MLQTIHCIDTQISESILLAPWTRMFQNPAIFRVRNRCLMSSVNFFIALALVPAVFLNLLSLFCCCLQCIHIYRSCSLWFGFAMPMQPFSASRCTRSKFFFKRLTRVVHYVLDKLSPVFLTTHLLVSLEDSAQAASSPSVRTYTGTRSDQRYITVGCQSTKMMCHYIAVTYVCFSLQVL